MPASGTLVGQTLGRYFIWGFSSVSCTHSGSESPQDHRRRKTLHGRLGSFSQAQVLRFLKVYVKATTVSFYQVTS